MKLLKAMLRYTRPAYSQADDEFCIRFLDSLPGCYADEYGNRIVKVGESRTMFASHTDTVHNYSGFQTLTEDSGGRIRSDANCLGADDTAGVWLMVRMVEQHKPGLYVFHRNEEVGCLGSSWIVKHTPDLVKEIDHVISLDRRGYDSVVTNQAGQDTASDQFATALADAIGLGMFADPTGVFTDSLSYSEVVAECTNISVGYHHAHTRREMLSSGFIGALLRSLLTVDFSRLPVVRKPVSRYDDFYGSAYTFGRYDYGDKSERNYYQLVRAVREDPEAAASLLSECGFTLDDLIDRDAGIVHELPF